MPKLKIIIFSSDSRLLPLWQNVLDNSLKEINLKNLIKDQLSYVQSSNSIISKISYPNIEHYRMTLEELLLRDSDLGNQGSWTRLLNYGIQVAGVVTNPPKTLRKKTLKNPVYQWAEKNKLKIYSPISLTKDNRQKPKIKEVFDDMHLALVGSYGQIIPKNVLEVFKLGLLNWHPSKLPTSRGATPVQNTILSNSTNTALTWLEVIKEMDAGDIFWQLDYKVSNIDTTNTLMIKALEIGSNTWALPILSIISGISEFRLTQNSDKATFCSVYNKDDKIIDPKDYLAKEIILRFRALSEFPGVYFRDDFFDDMVKLVEIETSDSSILALKDADNYMNFGNWLVSTQKDNTVYYTCKNKSLIIVKKVRLSSGKEINFKGYNFKTT